MTRDDRSVGLGLFVLTFVAYAWFFSGGGWNQNAHLDLTRAIVERQTLHIDGYHDNTFDITRGRDGHVFINKPPGASFLAAISYAPLYWIERAAGAPIDAPLVLTLNAWIVTVLTCGLTGAWIPVVLYAWLRRRFEAGRSEAVAIALVSAFGTIAFPYATMLVAQVPAALFLLLAVAWLDERPLAAGAAAGMAGLTYYVCIPAAIALVIAAALRSRPAAVRFAAGGLPFAVILATYQWACFGSLLQTSVEGSTGFTQESLLLGVFGAVSPRALWGITFSSYRGLFFVSPVLLGAFVGAVIMLRRRQAGRELAIVATIAGLFLIVVSSFNGWHGGSAFGPRYLLPIVPLLAAPMLEAVRVARPVWMVLAAVSVAMQLCATAVDPMPHAIFARPMQAYLLPAFTSGVLPEPVARFLGRHPAVGHVSINEQTVGEAGLYEKHRPDSNEALWASFNLGEIFVGPQSRASVLPVALWIVGGSALLLRRAGRLPPPRPRTAPATSS